MKEITYEQGMEDGLNYAIRSIEKAMDNPALDVLTPRQVLGILVATLKMKED
jgi:hypothetical protein